LKQAASLPSLFSELDSRFSGGRASDQAIKSYLLTMKFIPPAADIAVRSYRETKAFVDEELRGYNAEEPQSGQQVMNSPQLQSHPVPANITAASVSPSSFGANSSEIAN